MSPETSEFPPPQATDASSWQIELQRAFRRPADLLAFLDLPADAMGAWPANAGDFPLRVPRPYAARMRRRDPRDPLLLQVFPRFAESVETPQGRADPVGDLASLKGVGLLHKYQGRALLITTGACAVHCRYCFRRHFPYADASASRNDWNDALQRIRADDTIEEVILSGGDPLSMSDDKLGRLVRALDGIPHLKRLRLHTRQPIVLPARVDDALLAWLTGTRLQTVVVLHANHANEFDPAVNAACGKLRAAGAMLLNQSVLLSGVNDSVEALADLSLALMNSGALPYYLHLMDPVQGASHFDVDERMAQGLMQALAARLPGYLVPRLAREVPGASAKQVVAW